MIAEQTLTVRLPASVVAKLKRAAALTYRSVDDIVATTVDAALAEPPSVPADLAAEFAAMHLLSDQALQAAAQPSLSGRIVSAETAQPYRWGAKRDSRGRGGANGFAECLSHIRATPRPSASNSSPTGPRNAQSDLA